MKALAVPGVSTHVSFPPTDMAKARRGRDRWAMGVVGFATMRGGNHREDRHTAIWMAVQPAIPIQQSTLPSWEIRGAT
ncbi:hypothetical protein AN933_22435 [Mycobacterium intracellulare subsp. chimaera]|nr:hypothetical protein AN933_22435 [Mycobacterium intracellulare subsp. chimaera]